MDGTAEHRSEIIVENLESKKNASVEGEERKGLGCGSLTQIWFHVQRKAAGKQNVVMSDELIQHRLIPSAVPGAQQDDKKGSKP